MQPARNAPATPSTARRASGARAKDARSFDIWDSVISPEGAASILWHDTAKAQDAATNMKITAEDLMRFGVIDEIVPEPVGGAHRDPAAAIAATGAAISNALQDLSGLDRDAVRRQRRQKFLNIGRNL